MKQLVYLQDSIMAFTANYSTVWNRPCPDRISQDEWLVRFLGYLFQLHIRRDKSILMDLYFKLLHEAKEV